MPVTHPFVELNLDNISNILPPTIIHPEPPVPPAPTTGLPAFQVPIFHHGPPPSI
jgi:hypothetical protein